MAIKFRWPLFNGTQEPDQIQQPAQPAQPDLPPPWGNRTHIRVTGTARLNEPVLQAEAVQNMGTGMGEDVTGFLIMCASCRRVIHAPEGIGGICAVSCPASAEIGVFAVRITENTHAQRT